MRAYLLDTNHLGLAVTRSSSVGQRIQVARSDGVRLGTCLPAVCEIEAGMRNVRRKLAYERDLDQLLRQIRLWPIDRQTARIYGDIFNEPRRLGRVLSQVDMIIAALARQMKLTILTMDRDFEALADIETEDWSIA